MFIPLMIALSQPVNLAQAEPCKVSVVSRDDVNSNCPLLTGIFASDEWIIQLSYWEADAYVLKGINKINGKKITIIDSEVRGTVDRPQYPFSENRSETLYLVTFQRQDRDTIRLEIFADTVPTYNQLLHRTSSNDQFFQQRIGSTQRNQELPDMNKERLGLSLEYGIQATDFLTAKLSSAAEGFTKKVMK